MKVLDAKPEWLMRFSNTPMFQLLVDKIPHPSELRYKRKGSLYFAEHEGYVSFFAYDRPGSGYGGSTFNITMEDGTSVALKGPWSSRAGVMNQYFTPCLNVSMTDDLKAYERGHTLIAGSITLELAKVAAECAGVYLVKSDYLGEISWYPSVLPNKVVKPFVKYDVNPATDACQYLEFPWGSDRTHVYDTLAEAAASPIND